MAKDIFNRYIWLVDTIYQAKKITFEEINERWLRSFLSDGNDIPLRTFHNHRKAIEDIFDIIIECDRRDRYTYYIENAEDIETDGIRSWLLDTFAINNIIHESHKLKNRIKFEKIPSGQQYLTPIIEAMRCSLSIEITYQKFWEETSATFVVEPYFVKVFKQRWYLIAYNPDINHIRIYGLDRIKDMKTTDKGFLYPKDFNPDEYYTNSFGIIKHEEIEPCIVRIKTNSEQAKYIRSLPLHHSQEEIQTDIDTAIFQYYICPTFDFRKELLSLGAEIEVLEPEWFREEVRMIIDKMKNKYE